MYEEFKKEKKQVNKSNTYIICYNISLYKSSYDLSMAIELENAKKKKKKSGKNYVDKNFDCTRNFSEDVFHT